MINRINKVSLYAFSNITGTSTITMMKKASFYIYLLIALMSIMGCRPFAGIIDPGGRP